MSERSHVTIRLIGGHDEPGEIGLEELAGIARHAQELLLRIGRNVAGAAGPGRSTAKVDEATHLTLVGLAPGSTVLDIAGPAVEAEFDLGADVPASLTVQSFLLMSDSLEAVAAGASLPVGMNDLARESVDGLLLALQRAATEVTFTSDIPGRERREIRVVPERMLRRLGEPDPGRPEAPAERAIEGELFRIDLHTNRFGVADDTRRVIDLRVADRPEGIGHLVGQRVRAVGRPVADTGGRLHRLENAVLEPAPPLGDLDRAAFAQATDRADLLEAARPFASRDELGIEGVTDADVDDFLQALRA